MWAPCVTGASYSLAIDWNQDGIVTGIGEDVSTLVLGDGSWTFAYGRDQARQLSPSAIGRGSFSLCNVDRIFSPENESSPFFGDLGPAREVTMDTVFENISRPLFRSRIDDYRVNVSQSDLTVDFTTLDGMALLQNARISTEVYSGIRTGDIVNIILDAAEWPEDQRDIDVGASFARFWWADDKDALTAVQEIVEAEGPPAIAYVAPDGTFIFRDRHHRLLRTESLVSQASFDAARITGCDIIPVTGMSYTNPFTYEAGWRDIVNEVDARTDERTIDPMVDPVWESTDPFVIQSGETITILATTSEPMFGAITPQANSDYFWIGPGTVTVTLSRFSGQTIGINLTSTGGLSTVTFLRLRARLIPVTRMIQIVEQDPGSIDTFGKKTYPEAIPWATPNDVRAVAQVILSHYAQRRPTVGMRLSPCDEEHFEQILIRTLSDRITIGNAELGLSDDFFIESVSHVIRRIDPQRPPVHSAVFGCERQRGQIVTNPFTFDKVGAGFDQGQFGGFASDDPNTIFIFDHSTQGRFDFGAFAT